MRIPVRTSKWAAWAGRLGGFALPLAVIPILMHRTGGIETADFEVVEGLAIALALLALACSVIGLARIWTTGEEGWWRAMAGLVCSLICLVPPAILVADYLRYPLAAEVSTNPADPPPLLGSSAGSATAPSEMQAVNAHFPNLETRSYPLPPEQVFAIIDKLVADRGWEVRERHVPTNLPSEGKINAIAASVLGFRGEVSIRVRGDVDGSEVDMRSAALTPLHEAGDNARRVENFLAALDAKVTGLMNEQPAGAPEDDTDADSTSDPGLVVPAPAPRARKH